MVVDSFGPADEGWVAPLFASAFADDPGFTWMFPDGARRLAQVAWVQGLLVRSKIAVCVAEHIERSAAALWFPPDACPVISRWTELRAGIAWAPFAVGCGGTVRGLRADAAVKVRLRRVEQPAWYLDALAVAPDRQGRGLGGELLRRGLARAGATPVYLYTVKPENLDYYRRFGFEVIDDSALVEGGPPAWTMRTAVGTARRDA